MIDPHTLQTLEFDKVISLIAGRCVTPYGKGHVDYFTPMAKQETIECRHAEISEMQDIATVGAAFPLSRMEDVRDLLDRSTVEGIFLEPAEIRYILELLEVCIAIKDYDKDGRENFPRIAGYIDQIRAFPELRKDILKAIDERGEIKDSASSALKRIRADMVSTRRKLIARLESILSAHQKHEGWQDDVVMQRNGRYVIPVVAGDYRSDFGILHDRSQSGATLYVEPNETVETNNRLNLLFQEERLEIDRILRRLTGEIALRREALEEDIRLIGWLDAVHAAGRFARDTKSSRPRMVGDTGFSLIEARHPLLLIQSEDAARVIPLSADLGSERQAMIVTGPNTGGKTIALKTIGLLILMAQSGLLIPADEKSSVGIFDQVFADIGDEQSIELSLSTFSSHIRNIINALTSLTDKTLVLLDEIGAGTDPKEGASLAEAIILFCLKKNALLVATTHYSQLKTLPLEHPQVENASLEFDRKTLAPTYRLLVGIPGSSYAVEIASRLGMPREVCDTASKGIGTGERSLSELISSLEAELRQVKEDRQQLSDRLARAEQLESFYRSQSEKIKNEAAEEKEKSLAATRHLLDMTRRDVERMVSEIRKTNASKDTVRKAHRRLRELEAEVRSQTEPDQQPASETADQTSFEEGDRVRVISLDQTGEIETVSGTTARVRIGQFTTTAEFRNLEKMDGQSVTMQPRQKTASVKYEPEETMSPEVHLRGMTVEEATEQLDKYLDRARIAGLSQIYVIHGKGSGILRRTLTEYLQRHPDIESVRLGNWNEGGAGVTIAKLKS